MELNDKLRLSDEQIVQYVDLDVERNYKGKHSNLSTWDAYPLLNAQVSHVLSVLAEATPEELKEQILETILNWQYTAKIDSALANMILAKVLPAIEAAKREGRQELAEELDLYENELGFCEISNHIPFARVSPLNKGKPSSK